MMARRIFLYLLVVMPLVFAGVFMFGHNTKALTFAPASNGNYCAASITGIDTTNAQDVLSFIEYGESYGALASDKQLRGDNLNGPNPQDKINALLADPKPRDSSGLVPCGRQCDDPTTAVNEAVQCNFCHIFVLFHNIVNMLLTWALLLVILLVAAGGFLIMVSGVSGGGPLGGVLQQTAGGVQGLRRGKALIFSALAGYAIMLSAWIIVNLFFSLIGVASWVGIGNWWQPNCPVEGYVQNKSGTWQYQYYDSASTSPAWQLRAAPQPTSAAAASRSIASANSSITLTSFGGISAAIQSLRSSSSGITYSPGQTINFRIPQSVYQQAYVTGMGLYANYLDSQGGSTIGPPYVTSFVPSTITGTPSNSIDESFDWGTGDVMKHVAARYGYVIDASYARIQVRVTSATINGAQASTAERGTIANEMNSALVYLWGSYSHVVDPTSISNDGDYLYLSVKLK